MALALSLPAGSERETVVALTYGGVAFSILALGLLIGNITRKFVAPRSHPAIDEFRQPQP